MEPKCPNSGPSSINISKEATTTTTDVTINSNQALSEIAKQQPQQHQQQSSEIYYYKFDNPIVDSWGFIQIFNKIIQVHFPEKQTHVDYLPPIRDIQLYLNKQLIFHSHWLPAFTMQDLLKYKAMFRRTYHEYGNLIHYFYTPSTYFLPLDFTAFETIFNQHTFYLTCFENSTTTCIEFESKTNPTHMTPVSSTTPIHVQFYIGSHLTFCSSSIQQHVTTETFHFILSFILNKCIT
jgi:hypothetical protein